MEERCGPAHSAARGAQALIQPSEVYPKSYKLPHHEHSQTGELRSILKRLRRCIFPTRKVDVRNCFLFQYPLIGFIGPTLRIESCDHAR